MAREVEDELAALTKEADRINEEEEKALKDQRGDEIPKEIRKKETLRKRYWKPLKNLRTVREAELI